MFFAIPFFKNAAFLKETLFSLLDQTDANWSAVLLDDSIEMAETEAACITVQQIGDPRISYHKNAKNLGMAKNWNQAFDLADEQNFLVILHADDRLRPNYVQEMKALIARHPEASAYFAKTVIIGDDGKRVFSPADYYKKLLVGKNPEIKLSGLSGVNRLIPGNFIFCPSICYRVADFKNQRFDSQFKMVLDFEFILRSLLDRKIWVGAYEMPLLEYRRHSNNMTVNLTRNLSRFHEEIDLYRNLGQQLQKRGELSLAKEARKMRVIKLNLCFEIVKALLQFNFKMFGNVLKLLLQVFKTKE